MGRRYAGCGLMRRGVRDGAGASPNYQSVLGALGVEMWHSELGIALASGAVDTWTGQWRGSVLPAPGASQRPAYGADGSFGGGKSCVQTAITGSKILYAGALTSLAPAGSRPWLFTRGRFRDSAGVNEISVSGGSGRSIAVRDVFGNFGASDITTVNVNSGVALDFVMRNMEMWADGTNMALQLDAAQYTAAYTNTLENNLINFCVGASSQAAGTTAFSNYNSWLIIVASAYPGAAIAALIRTMAAAEFPP